MKKCIKCRQEKPLTDFHRHVKMKDGYRNTCKECRKAQSREYVQTERGKQVRSQAIKTWRKKYPEKIKAQKALQYAIKHGKVKRSSQCERCGEKKPLQGHHPDYSQPLQVIWACDKCHKILDKEKQNENTTISKQRT